MKIATRVVIDMATMEVIDKEEFDYDGPVARLGGGPSKIQAQQAADSAVLNKNLVDLGNRYDRREQQAYDDIAPFARSRMKQGLNYFPLLLDAQSGINARAFQPARAEVERRFSQYDGLPSGSKEAALRDIDAEQARSFDDHLLGALAAQDSAQVQGGELLRQEQVLSDPMRAYNTASQGMSNIYNSQALSNPGAGAILGGVIGGLSQGSFTKGKLKIPF